MEQFDRTTEAVEEFFAAAAECAEMYHSQLKKKLALAEAEERHAYDLRTASWKNGTYGEYESKRLNEATEARRLAKKALDAVGETMDRYPKELDRQYDERLLDGAREAGLPTVCPQCGRPTSLDTEDEHPNVDGYMYFAAVCPKHGAVATEAIHEAYL